MLRLHIYAFILPKQVEKKEKKLSLRLDKWNIICTDRWDNNKYNKRKVRLYSINVGGFLIPF